MIAKLWRGNYGLAKTFWLWGVLVTIILQFLLNYLVFRSIIKLTYCAS